MTHPSGIVAGLFCALLLAGCSSVTQPDRPWTRIDCIDRAPIVLSRTRQDAIFSEEVGNDDLVTDSWQIPTFRLREASLVSVSLSARTLDASQPLIRPVRLEAGDHAFVLSYGEIADRLQGAVDFHVQLTARAIEPRGSKEIASIPGYLVEQTASDILQRVLRHDVLIGRGFLSLRRSDLEFAGRDPTFRFIRSYRNDPRLFQRASPLGPGWSHNSDIELHVAAWGDAAPPYNLPAWVAEARGGFIDPSRVPAHDARPRLVNVRNGGLFKRVGDSWIVQGSFHGNLTEDAEGFVFESLDGTRYHFDLPSRPPVSSCAARSPTQRGLGPAEDEPVRWVESRNGHRLTYHYSESDTGRVVSEVTAPVKRSFRFTYDPPHDEPAGRTPRRLVRVEGPDGITLRFEYDDSPERLLKRFMRANYTETYRYEPAPGVAGTPPQGSVRPRSYRLTAAANSWGSADTYGYGGARVAPVIEEYEGFLPDLAVTSIFSNQGEVELYYGDGGDEHARRVVDENGDERRYVLNATENPIVIEDRPGSTLRWRWSIDLGQDDVVLLEEVDGEGHRTRFAYDQNGNRTQEIDDAGRGWHKKFTDRFSLPLWERSTDGAMTEHEYDDRGNLLTTVRSSGSGKHVSRYRYDRSGDRTEFRHGEEAPVRMRYDAQGNLVRIDYPDGSRELRRYDARNRLVEQRERNGSTHRWTYDALDAVTRQESEPPCESMAPEVELDESYWPKLRDAIFSEASEGAHECVVEHGRRLLAHDPGDERVRITISQALVHLGTTDPAREAEALALLEVVPEDDRGAALHFALGRLYRRANRLRDARRALARADALEPHRVEILAQLLAVEAELGLAEEAVRRIERSLATGERSADLLALLAHAQEEAGQDALAEKTYGSVIQEFGASESLVIALSAFYRRHGQHEKDLRLLARAATEIRDSPEILLQLGMALERAGHPEDAMIAYQACLALDSDEFIAMNNLAYILAERGEQMDYAVDLATRARVGRSSDPNVADTLAWVLYKAGLPAEGIPHLEAAIAMESDDPQLLELFHFHLALVCEAAGDRQRAREILTELVAPYDRRTQPSESEPSWLREARAALLRLSGRRGA